MSLLAKALDRPSTLKRAMCPKHKKKKHKKKAEGGCAAGGSLGKALDSGRKKKKKKKYSEEQEKQAADLIPAHAFVQLSGTKEEQAEQAYEAMCKMTPELDGRPPYEPTPALKHGEERVEKLGVYLNCGEKAHVKSGPHQGKNGVVISKKNNRHTEEWLDDEGAKLEKRKNDESYTLRCDNNTEITFNKPDEELEDYSESKHGEERDGEKRARGRMALMVDGMARLKTGYCAEAGPYCSPGDRLRCIDGDNAGKQGIVQKVVEDHNESENLESDGTVVSRERRTKQITLKPTEGESFTVDGTSCERVYEDDEDSPCETCASEGSEKGAEAPAQEGPSDELRESLEKIARLASRKILNGDVALDKLIEALAPKQADSDTVDAKVQVDEQQEGIGSWPKGDTAGGEQEALRVEPAPSNIEKMDEAISEAQN